ncbi:helix-turn-helix transcriptional regulator [Streptomyces sp. NPDC051014]|uniref:helix-turn-helix transcriptional regulator n=1 Tax=Streptomyces sp. NPDC051014 TaxID=3155751 RepID=UPI0033E1CC95
MTEPTVSGGWGGSDGGGEATGLEWLYSAAWGQWDVAAQLAGAAFGVVLDEAGARGLVRVLGAHHGLEGVTDDEVAGKLTALDSIGGVDVGALRFAVDGHVQEGAVQLVESGETAGQEDLPDPAWECLQAMRIGDWKLALDWAGVWCPGAVVDQPLLEACLDLSANAGGLMLAGESGEANAAAFAMAIATSPQHLDVWRERLVQLTHTFPPVSDTHPTVTAQPLTTQLTTPRGTMPGMDWEQYGRNTAEEYSGQRAWDPQQLATPPVRAGVTADRDVTADAARPRTARQDTPPDTFRLSLADRRALAAISGGSQTFDTLAKALSIAEESVQHNLRDLAKRWGMQDKGSRQFLQYLIATLPSRAGLWHHIDKPPVAGHNVVLTDRDERLLAAIANGHRTCSAIAEFFDIQEASVRDHLRNLAKRYKSPHKRSELFLNHLILTLPTRESLWQFVDIDILRTPQQGTSPSKRPRHGTG